MLKEEPLQFWCKPTAVPKDYYQQLFSQWIASESLCIELTILTNTYIHTNQSIADMLYNVHLVIVNTILRNRRNHGQTLKEKPLFSGHFFEHRVNILGKISC